MRLRNGKEMVIPDRQYGPQISKFFDLPPEIRCRVYEYSIGYHVVSWTFLTRRRSRHLGMGRYETYSGTGDIMEEEDQHFAALLKTCKLISQEAVPILYDQTQFGLTIHRNYIPSAPDFQYLNVEERFPTLLLTRIKHLNLILFDAATVSWPKYRECIDILSAKTHKGRSLKTFVVSLYDIPEDGLDADELASTFAFEQFRGNLVVDFAESTVDEVEPEKLRKLMKEKQTLESEMFAYSRSPDESRRWSGSVLFPFWDQWMLYRSHLRAKF